MLISRIFVLTGISNGRIGGNNRTHVEMIFFKFLSLDKYGAIVKDLLNDFSTATRVG